MLFYYIKLQATYSTLLFTPTAQSSFPNPLLKISSVPFHSFQWNKDHASTIALHNLSLAPSPASFNPMFVYFSYLNMITLPTSAFLHKLHAKAYLSLFLQLMLARPLHVIFWGWLLWKGRPIVLQVWFLVQQRVASPGSLWEMQFSGLTPYLLNQKLGKFENYQGFFNLDTIDIVECLAAC